MFTKGEWQYRPESTDYICGGKYEGCYKGVIHSMEDNMALAVIINDCVDGEANANLIASAPDLYEALNALMIAYGAIDGRNGNSGECWDLTRQALAKADGK